MKLKNVLLIIFTLLVGTSFVHARDNAGLQYLENPDPRNGAGTCFSCHNDPTATLVLNSTNLKLTGLPASYVPNSNYDLTLSILSPYPTTSHGFTMTANSSTNSMIGAWTVTDATTARYGTAGEGGGYANSYLAEISTTVKKTNWTIRWTAPAAGWGTATFYISTVADAGDGGQGGADMIYERSNWIVPELVAGDTTPPSVPALTLLTNNGATNSATPTLYWTASTDAGGFSNYTVWIGSNNTFINPVQVYTQTATNVTLSALTNGRWYWRVLARDNANNTSVSVTNSFYIDTNAPSAPVTTLPTNNHITNSGSVTFYWNAATDTLSGVSGYRIYIDGSAFTVSTTNYAAALAHGTHSWYVLAADNAGNIGVSNGIRTLSVDLTNPSIPSLYLPADASLTSNARPLFSWSAASDVGTGVSFSVIDLNGTLITNALTNYTPVSDLAEGVLQWRVRAYDNTGNAGSFSPYFSLTNDRTAPSTPVLVLPPNNTATNANTPTFNWSASTDLYGVSAYILIIDNNANLLSPETMITQATTNYLSAALAQTNWYWTVIARDNAGNLRSAAATNMLTVDSTAPSIPVSLSPTNAHITSNSSINISWGAASDALSGMSNYIVSINGASQNVTAANVNASGLAEGTNLWSVRSRDNAGNTSAWSVTNILILDTVAPSAPLLSMPVNLQIIRSNSMSFIWSKAADLNAITNYELVISNTTNHSGAATNFNAASLADGNLIWMVRGIDAAGNKGAWSLSRTLTVDTSAPSVVTLASPVSNSVTTSTSALLQWNAASDALTSVSNYILEVDDNAAFSSPAVYISNATSNTVTGLVNNSTNYWRVRAVDGANNTNAYSQQWSFLIDTNQIVPIQLSPANNTITGNPTPVFSWSDEITRGAGLYQIEVYSNAGVTLVASNTNIPVSQSNINLGSFANASYQWRVRAWKISSSSWQQWSGFFNLVIDTNTPSVPAPLSPTNLALIANASPVFYWSPSTDALSGVQGYYIVIDSITNNIGNATNYTSAALTEGVHSWRLAAYDFAGNTSAYCAIQNFTLDLSGPTMPTNLSPADLALRNSSNIAVSWAASTDSAAGVSNYELQIVTPLSSYSTNVTSNGLILALNEGTNTWTVRGRDKLGNMGTWSQTNRIIADLSAPAAPALANPLAGTTLTNLSVSFAWSTPADNLSGTAGYILQIDTNATPASWEISVSLTSNAQTLLLSDRSTNNFRVLVYDFAGNTNINSATNLFYIDTNQIEPLQFAPANAALLNSAPVTFYWSLEAGASLYEIEVRLTNISGAVYYNNNSIAASNINVTSLTNDGNYFWRVRAFRSDTSAWQTWSAGRNFMLDVNAPSIPAITSPISGSLTSNSSVSILWSTANDATSGLAGYMVEADNDIAFGTPWISSNLLSTSVQGTAAEGWNFYRVRAFDLAGNNGSYSTLVSNLVDLTVPSTPALNTPLPGASNTNTYVSFNWSASADTLSAVAYYVLSISSDVSMTAPAFVITNPGAGATNYTLSNLGGATWYWQVSAADLAGNLSAPSSTNSFIIITPPLPAPLITSVNPAEIDMSADTQFDLIGQWFTPGIRVFLDDAELTAVFINSNRLTVTVPEGLVPGEYSISVSNLAGDWVTAADALKVTGPSDAVKVKVNVVNPDEDGEIQVLVHLSSNSEKLKCTVFSLLGQPVRNLVSDENGNWRNITWDGKNETGNAVADGTYLLRIETGIRHDEVVQIFVKREK